MFKGGLSWQQLIGYRFNLGRNSAFDQLRKQFNKEKTEESAVIQLQLHAKGEASPVQD